MDYESAERCSMCRDGVSHSARCHHDEHEVCDRVAEGTDAPKSCACPCHNPADLAWIASAQIDIARDDLHLAQNAIKIGATAEAIEVISATIRQLEAARRHLA